MSVMHILFFLHESLFCTKGRSGQNDIFHLCSDDKDRFQFHLLSDLSKRGSTSCLYLSPFSFQAGETSTKHAVHFSGLSAHSRCRINLLQRACCWRSMICFYTDFICKMAVGAISFKSALCGLLAVSTLTSVVCTQRQRRAERNIFSLSHTNWRASVSVSVSVCVCVCTKTFCWKKKKRGTVVSCMYDNFFQERCISVLICGNLIIPVCIFLLILKKKQHFLVPNIQLKDTDSTTTMMQRFKKKQKADHLLPS